MLYVFSASFVLSAPDPQVLDWERNHDKDWGKFEGGMGHQQNWANDPNAGNYKLGNKGVGAFNEKTMG